MSIEATGDRIDQRLFWQAIGRRPAGVMIVAADAGQGPAGLLALSFAHVSASPPRILVSVGRNASAFEPIVKSGCFTANLLPRGSQEIAEAFGAKDKTGERFTKGHWESLETGAPVLKNAAVTFDCALRSLIEDEAAVVVIGDVRGLRVREGGGTLLANRGSYQNFDN